MYKRYDAELDALEAVEHTEASSIALRERWISTFEAESRARTGTQAGVSASYALMLRVNLAHYEDKPSVAAEKGLPFFSQFVKDHPRLEGLKDAVLWISDIAAEAGRGPEGIVALRACLSASADAEVARYATLKVAELLEETGKTEEALAEFRRIAKTWPDTPEGKRAGDAVLELTTLAPGQSAPKFSLTDSTGKAWISETLRGRWVWIEVYSPSCGACRRERPQVATLGATLLGRGVQVISICVDDGAPAEEKHEWPVVTVRGADAVVHDYQLTVFPRNFILDPDGVIRAKDQRGEELAETWKSLLK